MPAVKLANKARLVIGSTVVQIVMKSRMIFSSIKRITAHRRLDQCCDDWHRVFLCFDSLPATVPINEYVNKYSFTSHVSTLVRRDYHPVYDTDIAINTNPKIFEVFREIRWWKMY